MKTHISYETASKYLSYDPETGLFTRLRLEGDDRFTKIRNKLYANKQAGYERKGGYVIIRLLDGLYLAHRLAWLLHHKKWPECLIDHVNRIRNDNRIANLREANYSLSNFNKRALRNNISGEKGVSYIKKHDRWRARIKMGNKDHHIGLFRSKEEAVIAYKKASEKVLASLLAQQ